jgi:hypothetical protein
MTTRGRLGFLSRSSRRATAPVTDDRHEMTCVGSYSAYFADGSERVSTGCCTVDSNAEVVV